MATPGVDTPTRTATGIKHGYTRIEALNQIAVHALEFAESELMEVRRDATYRLMTTLEIFYT